MKPQDIWNEFTLAEKPRLRILELDHLMHQSMWMETSLILRGPLSQVKIGFSRILQTKNNAADRPGSFSNERPLSYIVPGAFHLGVKSQILSMLRKHAW